MQGLSQEKFSALKHSFRQVLLQKDSELASVAQRHWNHIQNRDYLFQKRFYVVEALETLSLEQVVASLSPLDRGSLTVQVRQPDHETKF